LQKTHSATVRALAQARMPSLSERTSIAQAKASSLSENGAGICAITCSLLWLATLGMINDVVHVLCGIWNYISYVGNEMIMSWDNMWIMCGNFMGKSLLMIK